MNYSLRQLRRSRGLPPTPPPRRTYKEPEEPDEPLEPEEPEGPGVWTPACMALYNVLIKALETATSMFDEADTQGAEPCIVFDLDKTILFPEQHPLAWMTLVMQRLLAMCCTAGVTVFFVSARPDTRECRSATKQELRRLGCRHGKQYAGLLLCPTESRAAGRVVMAHAKEETRRLIETELRTKFKIVMTVGDSLMDHANAVTDITHQDVYEHATIMKLRGRRVGVLLH